MTAIGLMIIILGVIFILMRSKHSAASKGLLLIGVLMTLAPQTPWIPQILTSYLQKPFLPAISYAWSDSNVIVVLGGGIEVLPDGHNEASMPTRSRALAAATAYYACKRHSDHCTLIASGGDLHNAGTTEASCIQTILIGTGVAQADIKTEGASHNTFENAHYTAKILRENYANGKVFLVTSSLHMQRGLLYFQHFGIAATPIISEWTSSKFGFKSYEYNAFLTDLALIEFWGMGRYYIYNWLGWNPAPIPVSMKF